MTVKEVAQKSIYATTGHISNQESLNTIESYILFNLDILREFKRILVISNYQEINRDLEKLNEALWKKYFNDCFFVHNGISKGRDFGAAENDNSAFEYCKANSIDWLCKSANDIILKTDFLETQVEEADFYYLNGIGIAGIQNLYNFDLDRAFSEDFFPQTNLYFINVNKCDYLNDKDHIKDVYDRTKVDSLYKGNPYDYGFKACEQQLKECIQRNNLKKYHLIGEETYKILLKAIVDYQIHDPSHKNIMINGVCHYHYKDQQVLEIPNI